MAIDIDKARRYAGMDPNADVSVMEGCVAYAQQWFEDAGVPKDTEGALYEHMVFDLAAWKYDNRGTGDSEAHVPRYIVESVHQMRPTRKAASA